MTVSAPVLNTEVSALSSGVPSTRFNQRERQVLNSVKTYYETMSGDATLADAALTLAPYIHVRSTTVSLTSTEILALNATPKALIAAPGAGKVIVPELIELIHTYSTAAYTNGGGGHVVFEWGDGTDAVVANAAMVTTASSANYLIRPSFADVASSGTTTPPDLTALANQNFRLTKATAEFGAGNAANIIKVRVTYRVITLLT